MQIPKNPWPEGQLDLFLKGHFYKPEAFLISEILIADREMRKIEAVSNPDMKWLVAPYQQGDETWHPRHVSGADLLMLTSSLGCLHAYFFHDIRWEEGWVGFGSRIEKAEFKGLAKTSEPLYLESTEIRGRRGEKNAVFDFEFTFRQGGKVVYTSKQTAMFVKK
jgi:hypothetical protein